MGSVGRNAMVAVGLLQMMVLMLMMSVFIFMIKNEAVDFMNILQIVSISFFLAFINSFLMIRQTLISPWEWQRRLAQRIGGTFDPVLNVIFETASNKNPENDGIGFPHLLNISALTDPAHLLSNPNRSDRTSNNDITN